MTPEEQHTENTKAHVQKLLREFMATPSGKSCMAHAEMIARQIVNLDVKAGVAYGELVPFVAGAVLKGVLFGVDMAVHSNLAESAWQEIGGCALTHALVFDATPPAWHLNRSTSAPPRTTEESPMGLNRKKLPAHVSAAIDKATPPQPSKMLAIGSAEESAGVVSLTLPYPPSANIYWRTRVIKTRTGGAFVSTYVSGEAKAFKNSVAMAVRASRVRPLIGEVEVEVHLYRPQKSGDLDNRIKVLLDSLRGLAFGDDAMVVKLTAERHEDKINPRAMVRVVQRAADLFQGNDVLWGGQ